MEDLPMDPIGVKQQEHIMEGLYNRFKDVLTREEMLKVETVVSAMSAAVFLPTMHLDDHLKMIAWDWFTQLERGQYEAAIEFFKRAGNNE